MPDHTGNIQPQLDLEEHDHANTAKRVVVVGGSSSGGLTDAELRATPVPVSGTVTVDTSTLATSAKQDTGNTSVASIDTKTPTLGQALAAASVPVILPSATITTLTPPAAITGFATSAKQLADNHQVTANLSATDNAVLDTIAAKDFATQTTLAAINTKLASGTVIGDVNLGATDNAVLDTIAAKDFATQTTLAALNTKFVTGTDIGDVTINNSTGAAAVNIQDGGNTITVDGTVAVTNAGITTIAGAVAGTEMQVDIVDEGDLVRQATTPTVYNIAMTNADTEYSQALPANTKKLTLQCQTAFDVRFAFATGKVATPTAPYLTCKSGQNYFEDNLLLNSQTIYVACPSAGKVAELIVWT